MADVVDEVFEEMDREQAGSGEPNVFAEMERAAPRNVFAEMEQQQPDVVDQVFAEDQGAEHDRLRLLFNVGQSADLDKRTQAVRLSEISGAPLPLVEENLALFKAAAEEAKFDPAAFSERFPILRRTLLERPALAPIVMREEERSVLSKMAQGLGRFVDFATLQGPEGLTPEDIRASASEQLRERMTDPNAARPEVPEFVPAPRMVPMVDAPEADLEGVARGRIFLSKFQQTRKALEMSRLGSQILLGKVRGQDVGELERKAEQLEREIGPQRFYNAGPFERIGLDIAEAGASQIESLTGQGLGMGAGYAAGRGIGAAATGLTRIPGLSKAGGKLGATLGGRIAGAAVSFNLEAGGAYLEFRRMQTDDGKPLSDDLAIGGALVYGALAAAIETGANEKLLAWTVGKNIAGGARKEAVQALLKDPTWVDVARKVGRGWAGAATTEGAEEFKQNLTQNLVGYGIRSMEARELQKADPGGALLEAIDAGAKGLTAGAAFGSLGAIRQGVETRAEGKRAAQQLQALKEAAEQSKTAKASPEAFAELVKRHSEESGQPLESVYVDPVALQRFFQENEADAAELLGESGAERIEEALSTGGMVQVPVAEFAEKWAGKPAAEALLQDMTTAEHLPTPNQSAAEQQEVERQAKEIADRFPSDAEPDSAAERRMVDAVQAELAGTGQVSANDAAASVLPLRQFIRTQAQRFGVRADDLFADVAVTVEKEQPGREQVAAQALPFTDDERQVLFHSPARKGEPERGYLEIAQRGAERLYRVVLRPNADRSTFLHESGHVFLDLTGELAERTDAPEQLAADYRAALEWLGAKDRASLTREQHERWARAFEAYLMEGKAPSSALGKAFHRFKLWLGKVYRGAASLNVELSDDVRGIFDRLLATEEEIASAKRRMGLGPMFRSPAEMFGLSDPAQMSAAQAAQWQAYLEGQAEASRDVALRADFQALKARQQETERWWKEEEAALRKEAEAEFDRLPAVRAWRFLQGKAIDGVEVEPVKLRRADVEAILGAEGAKKLAGKVKKDGVSPEDVAQLFGFGSGRAFLEALRDVPDRAAWAKEKARERMRERYPDVAEQRVLLTMEVEKGLHGDHTAEWLLREWAALGVQTGKNGRPPVEAVKRAAQLLVERRKVGELQLERILQAERTAGERASRAAIRGNKAAAYVYKQQQLLNLYLYRAARDAAEEMASAEKYLAARTADSFRAGLGMAGEHYLKAHDAILSAIGVGEQTVDPQEAAEALATVRDNAAASANEIAFDFDPVLELVYRPRPWSGLLLGEARNVRDAVKNIRALAVQVNEVQIAGEKLKVEEVVQTIAEESASLPDQGKALNVDTAPLATRAKLWIQGAGGALVEPEGLFRKLGPTAHRVLFEGYVAARNVKHQLAEKVGAFILDRWSNMPAEMRAHMNERVPGLAEELPADHVDKAQDYTHGWLWMVALNMGNESNRERLLGGYGWTEQQVLDVLDKRLTRQEWEFIQGVWDLNDAELWPMVAEKERRKTGLPPGKIAATPIQTRHGLFRGGYFPARYDKHGAAGDIGARQAEAAIVSLYGPSYVRASTQKSHTKKRADHYENVILLDWNVVPAHYAQVLHDLAFDEFVRGAGRIVFHPKMQRTLQHRLGQNRKEEPQEWLKHVANVSAESVPGQIRFWQGAINDGKSMLAMAALGWSVTVAAGDLANPLVVMATGSKAGGVSARYGVPAMLDALQPRWHGFAVAKSAELRARRGEGAKRLREMLLGIGKGGKYTALERIRATGWWFMEQTDKLAATHVWLAAYRENLARGMSEADAVRDADGRVRANLPAQETAEQPAILRDRRGLGALLIFHGYMNKVFNVYARVLGTARNGTALDVAEAAGRVLAVTFFVGVLAELYSGRGREEDEEVGEWILRKMLATPVSTLPFGTIFEPAIAAAVTGKRRQMSVRAAPAMAVAEKVLVTFSKLVNDEREDDEKIADALELSLTLSKLPARQVRRTGDALRLMFEGEDIPLESLAYGPPREQHQAQNPVSFIREVAE